MFCVVCIDRIRFIASSGAQSILAFNHFFRTELKKTTKNEDQKKEDLNLQKTKQFYFIFYL